jgi:hypothetical protein
MNFVASQDWNEEGKLRVKTNLVVEGMGKDVDHGEKQHSPSTGLERLMETSQPVSSSYQIKGYKLR